MRALHLTIAILNLAFLTLKKKGFWGVSAVLVAMLASGTSHAWQTIGSWQKVRQIEKACYELKNLINPGTGCPVDMNLGVEPQKLEELGFRHFAKPSQFAFPKKESGGQIERVVPDPSDQVNVVRYQVNGAINRHSWQADPILILLSYGESAPPSFIDVTTPYPNGTWQSEIYAPGLPVGRQVIRAWAYNGEFGVLTALEGAFTVTYSPPDKLFQSHMELDR